MVMMDLDCFIDFNNHIHIISEEAHKMWGITLNTSLDHQNDFESFDVESICNIINKYYLHDDFIEHNKIHLSYQLDLFKLDILRNQILKNVFSLFELY